MVTSPVVQSMRGLFSWSHSSPRIRFSCPQFTTKNSVFFLVSAMWRWRVTLWWIIPPWLALPSIFYALSGWKSLCIWYPFFLTRFQSIKSPVPPLSTRAKVSTICAPSFTKMEMGMQMDFSFGSDTNTGAIISGGKNVDIFLWSKSPWLVQFWWWLLFPPFLHLLQWSRLQVLVRSLPWWSFSFQQIPQTALTLIWVSELGVWLEGWWLPLLKLGVWVGVVVPGSVSLEGDSWCDIQPCDRWSICYTSYVWLFWWKRGK